MVWLSGSWGWWREVDFFEWVGVVGGARTERVAGCVAVVGVVWRAGGVRHRSERGCCLACCSCGCRGEGGVSGWLTKRELARELRVSVRTIERLKPPCMAVGGQNRYRLDEVVAFLRGDNRPLAAVVELRPERGETAA